MDSRIDDELDHIEAVLSIWLPEIEVNPFLTPAYWRQRVCSLMSGNQLLPEQFQRADSLLITLDRFDARCAFSNV